LEREQSLKDQGRDHKEINGRDRMRVHGSINILWIRTAMAVEECAARYLADLKAAASEIVSSLQGSARR
jgi:hypothetical protein